MRWASASGIRPAPVWRSIEEACEEARMVGAHVVGDVLLLGLAVAYVVVMVLVVRALLRRLQ